VIDIRETMRQDWSLKSPEETITALESSDKGLSASESTARLTILGPNEIAQGKPTPWYILLGRQFADPLIYILLAAAAITGITGYLSSEGHMSDVIIILTVLIVNASIGFYQERKAERAINNIKGMTAPHCRVKRAGELQDHFARELVPGDIIELEQGDRVPADARLLSTVRFKVEEAIFTGETTASQKQIDKLEKAPVLADKLNMIFMGTHVVSGRGEAVVTATGMGTELGKIAGLVQSAEEVQTPLQKRLEKFSEFVAVFIFGICILIFISSYLIHGQSFSEVLLNAIALAVGAIPEGLPVIITLVLAIGVRRMAQHNALIRKLPIVETLGSATVICSDKTGTLTRNEMVVTEVYVADQAYRVSGQGYSCEGQITPASGENTNKTALSWLIETAVSCNNAAVNRSESGEWHMTGDGTEGALMTLGGKFDLSLLHLRDTKKRSAEIPFDSKYKFMVTIHPWETAFRAHLKGSLETVLSRCSKLLGKDGIRPLTTQDIDNFQKINLRYADAALRILGFAFKDLGTDTDLNAVTEEEQKDYTFLGLVGMMDLPRPEAIEAVAKCKLAGIKVVMITGDHAATAMAVGKKVGLFEDGMRLITGEELQKLDENALQNIVDSVAIYARTSPEDKMRIIKAWQTHGHVVSMTGDGVNDAPALTRADIGVAMGRSGTDVAREAAGMVLVDDNFASIVSAVEEGRIIFNNLRKAIGFLCSTNAGEVLTLLVASLMGFSAPLRAAQILWVNLVTDGFTTIALGFDPPEGDEMKKRPRMPDEPLLSRPMMSQVVIVSILMCIGTLAAYVIGYRMTAESPLIAKKTAETMAFGTMVFFQLFNIFNCRSYEKSLLKVGIFGNMTLVWAVFVAILLQLAAMYLGFMQELLGTVSLNAWQMGFVIAVSLLVFPAVELSKWFRREEK